MVDDHHKEGGRRQSGASHSRTRTCRHQPRSRIDVFPGFRVPFPLTEGAGEVRGCVPISCWQDAQAQPKQDGVGDTCRVERTSPPVPGSKNRPGHYPALSTELLETQQPPNPCYLLKSALQGPRLPMNRSSGTQLMNLALSGPLRGRPFNIQSFSLAMDLQQHDPFLIAPESRGGGGEARNHLATPP